jgi:mono/diheme cytochrome c family protein
VLVLPCTATTLVIAAVGAFALSGCGDTQAVKPKAIAFEPTIIGCSGSPTECTSATAAQIRELREAHNHLCPEDRPNVLVKADGALVCVATLPSAGPTAVGVSIPSAVRAQGLGAVANFKAGAAVVASTGCLACHRIAEAGNPGPGSDLTHVGARLPPAAIERALVDSPAPMPSFSRLPNYQRRALVDFLAQLR